MARFIRFLNRDEVLIEGDTAFSFYQLSMSSTSVRPHTCTCKGFYHNGSCSHLNMISALKSILPIGYKEIESKFKKIGVERITIEYVPTGKTFLVFFDKWGYKSSDSLEYKVRIQDLEIFQKKMVDSKL